MVEDPGAHHGVSCRSKILLLIPLVSTALAVLFLGERLSPTILAGTALVVAGVLVVQRHGEEAPHAGNA